MLRSLVRIVIRAFAAFGLLVTLVMVTPVVSWWARAMAGPWNDPSGPVLIVLGGATVTDGIMGESSYWRSVYAIQAYREGHIRQIILSGGGDPTRPIVEPMRDFLQCHGVPAAAMQLEVRSTTTRENALYTSELIASAPGRKVLLTSDYHMFRAHRAFKKIGVDVEPRPIPDALKRAAWLETRWGAFVDVARESVAIVYYLIRGWI